MIRVPCSTVDGEPEALYRTPAQIRRDIYKIKERIDRTNERLNIREMISGVMDMCLTEEPARVIAQLEQIVGEASDTLDALRQLGSELEMLREELGEARWAVSR